MHIVLVEDNGLEADQIQGQLAKAFVGARVVTISSEEEFRRRLDEIVRGQPDIVIMDVMVRWTVPSPRLEEPPDDVKDEGPWRAGLRCQKLLTGRAPGIPVLLYTVLRQRDLHKELKDLPGNVVYCSKEEDYRSLSQALRALMEQRDPV